MGKQIAEGGFSYVFEAFPVKNNSTYTDSGRGESVGTPSKKSRMLLSSSSQRCSNSSLTSSSMGDDYNKRSTTKKYALKRINCSDHEIIQSCRHEAGIHRSLPVHHPNLLELLGLKFDNTTTSDDNNMSSSSISSSSHGHGSSSSQQHIEYNVCYMLFPYITNSLRDEITFRNIISHDISNNHQSQSAAYNSSTTTRRQPFSTKEVLHLFGGLLDAVTAMHNSNISHRDIKLENVLLNNNMTGYDDDGVAATTTRVGSSSKSKSSRMRMQPVLMDFGSAGPLTRQIKSRQDVLTIVEESASHTTLPYRPPELFDGGLLRYNNNNNTEVLDYGKVDVWSLGCVLFGLMHGISPYEMEYTRRGNSRGQYGLVRVVECTHLKILDEVPLPPWASVGKGVNDNDDSSGADGRDGKYPLSIYKFVRYMVNHDRNQRPNIHEACQKFGELYLKLLGERWVPYEESGQNKKGNDDDFDSLIASRDFV